MSEEDKYVEEKGFKVIDRRDEVKDEDEPAQTEKAKETPSTDKSGAHPGGPAAGPTDTQPPFSGEDAFAQFILSLATSAYLHLGLIPGQDGKPVEKNLPLAKQTIDILGMLETKTKGNRIAQEDALMEQILSELRMRYVEEKKKS